jgi:glucose/mannose-6-phosphate isomerase
MPDLDAPESWGALDPQGMLSHIADLPRQCEDAWKGALGIQVPDKYRQARLVVIVGVGGSAIGADLLRGIIAKECRIPVIVHREYGLPAFVDRHTVVMACSHSGDTEETLVGFEDARQRRAQVLAVATGGELAQRAREHGLPLFLYHYASQPRAALGYSLITLLGIVQALGLLSDKSHDVAEAVSVARELQSEIRESVPSAANAAKSLALRLRGRLPVVYGAEHLSEVARRWKGQFNENSKSWSTFDVLPELDHNTVAGYALPTALTNVAHVVMLTSATGHPRVRLRFEITRELLQQHGFACDNVEARGQSALAQVLSTVHFGDYVSYYLAMLYEVDPWAIEGIQFVKSRLSQ